MRCPYLEEGPLPFPDEVGNRTALPRKRNLPTIGVCSVPGWGFKLSDSDLEKCRQLPDSQECWKMGVVISSLGAA